nr:hypothetical protein CFP56_24514 [Quercus suber]
MSLRPFHDSTLVRKHRDSYERSTNEITCLTLHAVNNDFLSLQTIAAMSVSKDGPMLGVLASSAYRESRACVNSQSHFTTSRMDVVDQTEP